MQTVGFKRSVIAGGVVPILVFPGVTGCATVSSDSATAGVRLRPDYIVSTRRFFRGHLTDKALPEYALLV